MIKFLKKKKMYKMFNNFRNKEIWNVANPLSILEGEFLKQRTFLTSKTILYYIMYIIMYLRNSVLEFAAFILP